MNSSILGAVFTLGDKFDVLSFIISLYFLEHSPARLLLAPVPSQRRTPRVDVY